MTCSKVSTIDDWVGDRVGPHLLKQFLRSSTVLYKFSNYDDCSATP